MIDNQGKELEQKGGDLKLDLWDDAKQLYIQQIAHLTDRGHESWSYEDVDTKIEYANIVYNNLSKQLTTTQQALDSAVEANKWQLIATAPKDGSKIETFHKIHKCVMTVKYIVDKRYRPKGQGDDPLAWLSICGSNCWPQGAFTHWRVLTESPEAALASIKEQIMTRKYVDFSWQLTDDGYEVLFYINNKPRRFAFCDHKNDAETIVDALKARYPDGFTVYPPTRVSIKE